MAIPEGFQVVNGTEILGFFEDYAFLSNFHPSPIVIGGVQYRTVEHAYMAYKTTSNDEKLRLSRVLKANEVKKEGQKVTLRPDWEYMRVAAMHHCLYEKFKIPELREALAKTGNKYLEEKNWWNDKFWGVCNGEGLNMLGKLLMMVREQHCGLGNPSLFLVRDQALSG